MTKKLEGQFDLNSLSTIKNVSSNITDDLGIIIDPYRNVETYYNYNNLNQKSNMKYNTFQQTSLPANVLRSAHLPPPGAIAPLMREEEREKNVGSKHRLNPNENYVQIGVQLSKMRTGTRYNRCRVYFSLMGQQDSKYTVWLSGALTDALHEIERSTKDNHLIDVVKQYKTRNLFGLMLGRLHYKPCSKYQAYLTRKNLKSVMAAMYFEDTMPVVELYIYHEFIKIEMQEELTESQKQHYSLSGLYRTDYEETDE